MNVLTTSNFLQKRIHNVRTNFLPVFVVVDKKKTKQKIKKYTFCKTNINVVYFTQNLKAVKNGKSYAQFVILYESVKRCYGTLFSLCLPINCRWFWNLYLIMYYIKNIYIWLNLYDTYNFIGICTSFFLIFTSSLKM